jgi:hypothetical protein
VILRSRGGLAEAKQHESVQSFSMLPAHSLVKVTFISTRPGILRSRRILNHAKPSITAGGMKITIVCNFFIKLIRTSLIHHFIILLILLIDVIVKVF